MKLKPFTPAGLVQHTNEALQKLTEHTHRQHALLPEAEDLQTSRVAQTQQICQLFCRRWKGKGAYCKW